MSAFGWGTLKRRPEEPNTRGAHAAAGPEGLAPDGAASTGRGELASAGASADTLGRFEPAKCWKGIGAVTIVSGPRAAFALARPLLEKLGWHHRVLQYGPEEQRTRSGQAVALRECMFMPLSRWRDESPSGEVRRLATELALAKAGMPCSPQRARELAEKLRAGDSPQRHGGPQSPKEKTG